MKSATAQKYRDVLLLSLARVSAAHASALHGVYRLNWEREKIIC